MDLLVDMGPPFIAVKRWGQENTAEGRKAEVGQMCSRELLLNVPSMASSRENLSRFFTAFSFFTGFSKILFLEPR